MSAREVLFDPSWRSFTAIQGGLVIGELLTQAVAAVGGTPRTLHAHLLASVVPGQAAQITARPDRIGKSCSVRAELSQNGKICALAQVLTMNRSGAARWDETTDLDRPDPDQGEPLVLPPEFVPFAQHVDIQALGMQRPLSGDDGPPRLTAWVRLRPVLDPLTQLAVVLDCLPPSLFASLATPTPLPTAELTAHFARPAPPAGAWLHVDQRTTWRDDLLAVDDATIHDSDAAVGARHAPG